jgi:hypothetical protein
MSRQEMLKTMGLPEAAVSNTVRGETTFEKVTDYSTVPLKRGLSPYYMDVQKGQLYSALVVDDKFIQYKDQEGNAAADFKFNMRLKKLHEFFKYSVGMPNPYYTPWVTPGGTITRAETNMYQPCRLDVPEAFAIQRVGVVFSPMCDLWARTKLIENYCLTVWIGQKSYARLPLASLFSVGVPTDKQFHDIPVKGMVDLEPLPLLIENQVSFHATIDGTPFESGYLKLWVVYDGLHARGVQ